jgi:hypothetical protein
VIAGAIIVITGAIIVVAGAIRLSMGLPSWVDSETPQCEESPKALGSRR